MRWFRRLLGSEGGAPPSPVLLRVQAPCGSPAAAVDVRARWLPSGRTTQRSHRTADGLCVVSWMGDEERVELTLRCELGGAAALELHRDRPDGGRVRDVALDASARVADGGR